jgi:hypothetical protein
MFIFYIILCVLRPNKFFSDHSPVFSTFLLKARLPIYARFMRHTLPVSEQCVIMLYELQGNLLYKEAGIIFHYSFYLFIVFKLYAYAIHQMRQIRFWRLLLHFWRLLSALE